MLLSEEQDFQVMPAPDAREVGARLPALPVAMIGTDHVEVGPIQGRQCRALLPQGAKKHVNERAFAATVIAPSNTGPALELVARWLENGKLHPREVIMNPTSHSPVAELQPWGAS